jgi:polar amino acid transport system ATP-binding protein
MRNKNTLAAFMNPAYEGPILSVSHLAKAFDTTDVLRDISFTVNKGECLAIIGPSGSGKSTLLRCLNLLETPSSRYHPFQGAVHSGQGSQSQSGTAADQHGLPVL